jgi:hypothetical protein
MQHFSPHITRAASLAVALLGLTGTALANNTGEVFGERALALAMDDRCGLFTDGERAALDAGRLQARGSLLRDGISVAALDDYSRELRAQAANTPCDIPEVADLRWRVGEAYIAWLRLRDMIFPGETFTWTATRSFEQDKVQWALLQDTGSLRIGYSREGHDLRLSAAVPNVPGAASAVLVTRDTRRAPDLYDATMNGQFTAPAGAEWAKWTPPGYARTVTWAAGMGDRQDRVGLTSDGDGLVFHFTRRAADTLAALDPREAARIEVLDRNGEPLAIHYFEIGDFAAARTFVHDGSLSQPRS